MMTTIAILAPAAALLEKERAAASVHSRAKGAKEVRARKATVLDTIPVTMTALLDHLEREAKEENPASLVKEREAKERGRERVVPVAVALPDLAEREAKERERVVLVAVALPDLAERERVVPVAVALLDPAEREAKAIPMELDTTAATM